MRDLVLILPDLFLFDSDAASARGPGLARLRFARSTPLRGGWRGLLARGLGRADLVAVDPAEVVAAEVGASDPWLLSPLHLVPGLKTVHLAPGGCFAYRQRRRLSCASSSHVISAVMPCV